ncbi:rhomboid family intramembrane serine protease [Allohahella marinimesophila]|uniref:Membrane associated rhomboid family serine protease n=1 Tax=Allohahella marinimesophila TaxID=1054972 RepID=A0ABP7PH64_9GAMM
MSGKKYCPQCRTAHLTIKDYDGEEVDICRQCGGVWFEKADLDALVAAKCQRTDYGDYVADLGPSLDYSNRECPDCSHGMQIYHLLNDYHVDIDVCRACDGAWVARDTVSKVVKSAAIKHAIQDMNQSTSWKTWVFEALLRMPVEYNVKPRITPWVTIALVIINSLIFISYGFDLHATNMIFENFALAPAVVQEGNGLWSFITATFLHGSMLHLAGNMYFLWLTGDNLEDALGHGRFLAIYLVCGILAGTISVLANLGSPIPSVGASGAIAGLFGMYLLWFPKASMTFMFVVWQKKLAVMWYFGIWLGLNFFGMSMGQGGVDYWAHIGGFAVGLTIGAALRKWVWTRNPLLAHLAGPEVQVKR